MEKVYGNAELVLAASVASTAHDGFLRDRPQPRTGRINISLTTPMAPLEFAYALIPVHRRAGPSYHDPLDHRAWAFQERLLAKRYLADRVREMTWECYEDQYCECSFCYSRKRSYFDTDNIYHLLELAGSLGFRNAWKYVAVKFTQRFTQRVLTVPSDRFVAISAIASKA